MGQQQPFELEYKKNKIKVQQHAIGTQVVFRVNFEDRRKPLVLTRSVDAAGKHWWTSVPEGRQPEAEEIGNLIAAYIHSKQT